MGIIGLGVMGQNLALNLAEKRCVAVWNRNKDTQREFELGRATGKPIRFYASLERLVDSLDRPRVLLLMVSAGTAVDEMVEQLAPLLDEGDVLVDGGNSHYKDTQRRVDALALQGIRFVGVGISGGEEGALHGASLMPGGDVRAWPVIEPLLKDMAARNEDGTYCCEWMGPEGSGHFVKMVHNGLEYADMQLIAEACSLLLRTTGITRYQMADILKEWNRGPLSGYLLEITADILVHKERGDGFLLDHILDVAGQKGTGKWCVEAALELGVPLDGVAGAVFMRDLSVRREWRERMSALYRPVNEESRLSVAELSLHLEQALYAARAVNYAQGFELLRQASETYGWKLNLSAVARIWRNGCILRSAFLERIVSAYESNPALDSLLSDSRLMVRVKEALPSWRQVVSVGVSAEVTLPLFSALLNHLYAATEKTLPTRLIQAMRDYFGAHRFERTDAPRGRLFHEVWKPENV